VAITSPAAGAFVWGTVNVQFTAADDVGIKRIELRVDGLLVGTFSGSTRSISWDSRKVPEGAHKLAVRVVDAAANARDASVVVSVRPLRGRRGHLAAADCASLPLRTFTPEQRQQLETQYGVNWWKAMGLIPGPETAADYVDRPAGDSIVTVYMPQQFRDPRGCATGRARQ
jgi:hypothetical protein